jgi:hypothetical protein
MATRKETRLKAGLSITAAAALCGVAPPTFRLWEVEPSEVSEESRGKCARGFERIKEQAGEKNAA